MSYVYVLDFGDMVKVGYTKHPQDRVANLQSQLKRKAVQTFFVEGSIGVEQEVHRVLTPFRIEKEWYQCSFEYAKIAITDAVGSTWREYEYGGGLDNLPRYTLRINQIMLDKLEYVARYNGRSKNKEIEMLIRQHIREFEKENGKIELEDAE